VAIYGDALPRKVLQEGFRFENAQVRLVGPQGIFKPQCMQLPLSITTTAAGPYSDSFTYEGLLLYSYRGADPFHRDNAGLRRLKEISAPLVYFHQVDHRGGYVPAWPVFIVGDDPERFRFYVAVDDMTGIRPEILTGPKVRDHFDQEAQYRRAYATRSFRQRLHQSSFRERVLRAYQNQCALCRLRHRELLDAAHIIPDEAPDSDPVVSNGIALCKLHHAAFDRFFVGVREDYVVEIRSDILTETDGPMLLHGLQRLHGTKIILPRAEHLRPRREFLQQRYELFRQAG